MAVMVPATVTSTPNSTAKIPISWPCGASLARRRIVEIIAPEPEPGDAGAGVDQHAQRHHALDQALRRDALGGLHAENEGIEDHHAGGDDARLEAAAGPEVAVELYVERKQQDERQKQLGADAQDEVELHAPFPAFLRSSPTGLRRRRPLSSSITPMPAVKMTVVSPSVS